MPALAPLRIAHSARPVPGPDPNLKVPRLFACATDSQAAHHSAVDSPSRTRCGWRTEAVDCNLAGGGPAHSRVQGVAVAHEVGAADGDARAGGDGVRVAEGVVVEEEERHPVHSEPVRDVGEALVGEHVVGAELVQGRPGCAAAGGGRERAAGGAMGGAGRSPMM